MPVLGGDAPSVNIDGWVVDWIVVDTDGIFACFDFAVVIVDGFGVASDFTMSLENNGGFSALGSLLTTAAGGSLMTAVVEAPKSLPMTLEILVF